VLGALEAVQIYEHLSNNIFKFILPKYMTNGCQHAAGCITLQLRVNVLTSLHPLVHSWVFLCVILNVNSNFVQFVILLHTLSVDHLDLWSDIRGTRM